jgi:phenylalanyl-tRNA synthetase beta chain
MKLSERWLREWFDPAADTAEIAERLTLAGLEMEGMTPAAPPLTGVIVAEVRSVSAHPESDNLSVCTVFDGGECHQVVCGAPNVRPGLKTAYAAPGTAIGDGSVLTRSPIRGIDSAGMLCSANELGLGEDAGGIIELPGDAANGVELREFMQLDDTILEVNLTPNRADCFCVSGVARDLSALFGGKIKSTEVAPVAAASTQTLTVELAAPHACPIYAGRVINDVDPTARTPLWMSERLRRAGVRCIHPLVDVTNYVMLELGQPMHAFDFDKLAAPIVVREARAAERIALLDDTEVELATGSLLITDRNGPIALAGIMGGAGSAVSEQTVNVFLESAFFEPIRLAGAARRYRMHTDASQRFERGVDSGGQARAIERATQLILEICGGVPGPCVVTRSEIGQRPPVVVYFRPTAVKRLLGIAVAETRIASILRSLAMKVDDSVMPWRVEVPSFRFDISIEADLVEEVARIQGYDAIPSRLPMTAGLPALGDAMSPLESRARGTLSERGYFEAITYSFIDPALAHAFDPVVDSVPLANPISSEMSVLRRSIWPGLAAAALHNRNRQVDDVRLFELGMVFRQNSSGLQQPRQIAGLRTGPAVRVHWSDRARDTDFYDIKQDVEALMQTLRQDGISFTPTTHPALHPGQTAAIVRKGVTVGHIGALHPAIGARMGFDKPLFLFEIYCQNLDFAGAAQFHPISKFPAVRRDIAVVVDETVSAARCLEVARDAAGALLRDLQLFDVYRGQGIDSGKKSLALGLIFQTLSSTLTDDEVEQAVRRVLAQLRECVGGTLRD